MKSTIILVNGIQENRGHKWGDKNVFGKNNGSKFSKLTETYKMQKAQYISNIRNIKITTPRYSIITLLITSDEEKNFEWLEKTKGV